MQTQTIAVADLLAFLKTRGVEVTRVSTEPETKNPGRPKLVPPPNTPSEIARLYDLNFHRLRNVVDRVHQTAKEARRKGEVRSADRYARILADRWLRPFLRSSMGFTLPADYFRTNVTAWTLVRYHLITRGYTSFFICGKQDGKAVKRQIAAAVAEALKAVESVVKTKKKAA